MLLGCCFVSPGLSFVARPARLRVINMAGKKKKKATHEDSLPGGGGREGGK